MATIDAIEMARQARIDPKLYRKALRAANLAWHDQPYKRWTVTLGSSEHSDMQRILNALCRH